MTTDDELLDAAQRGDERALAALLERHEKQIYRFGMAMCRDPEDAKDVLQDTLLAVARNVRDFRGASSVSTWLYAIARRFCIKRRRKNKHAPDEPRSLESEAAAAARLVDPAKPPDDAVASKQIEAALARAIGALDRGQREVLVLRDVEGLTAPEVAEVLGTSVDAVKSKLHRARLAVRDQVAPLLGIPAPSAPVAAAPCPDVLSLFSRHLEDEISAETCAEMERHLASCERCRGACNSLKKTLALCRTAPAAEVPADVQRSVRAAVQRLLSAQR